MTPRRPKGRQKEGHGTRISSAARAARSPAPGAEWVLAALIPAGVALVLSLPTFSFTYLFDDYDFLGRAQNFHWGQLVPDPNLLFYRPLSREIYFGILYALDPNHPIWGRVANGGLFLIAVVLLGSITTKLAGLRAGLGAATAFACLGAIPVIVGWTSGCQDLLAIVFVLVALRAELSGRAPIALAALACALLSKETAVALVPAIVALRWLAGKTPHRFALHAAAYGLLAVAWAAVHPGVRQMLRGRLESDNTGVAYLTLQSADRWGSLGKGMATLFNIPTTGGGTPWPSELNATFVIAAALVSFGFWKAWRAGTARSDGPGISAPRFAALLLLLTVPPLVLISFLVHNWQPYYLALAAIGSSMLIGTGLSRLAWPAAAAAALGFLALGIWFRGMDLGAEVLTERNVRPPMEQVRALRASFRSHIPALPSAAHVYVSVYTPAVPAAPLHLFRFQALRLWYRDRAIDTMHPEWRRPDPPSERLAWVGADLSVHEIDVRTLRALPDGSDSTSYEYGATIRGYAQGLAASGRADRAVEILLAMPAPDSFVAALNRRLAAAFLLADGREGEAAALLRSTETIDPGDAIDATVEIVANPSRRDIDRPVLEALGVSPADTAAVRAVMRKLALGNRRGATIRFAHRLLDAKPGDWEALALLRWLQQGAEAKRVTAPAVSDSLW